MTTTAVVPTTAAVRATGAPTTPRRAARAGLSGMSLTFLNSGALVGRRILVLELLGLE